MPHYHVHTPIRGRATAGDIIDLDVADAAGLVAIGAITPAATPPAPADQAPTPPPRSKRPTPPPRSKRPAAKVA